MPISDRRVPPYAKITIGDDAVLSQPGVKALGSRISGVFARWSRLEKQLNQLFTLVTDADPTARSEYDGLKGWDRRVEEIAKEAGERISPETADLVKVVLRLVKLPARKRDELAHRRWAVAEGFESDLVLMPPNDQHAVAEAVVAAKQAGRSEVPVDFSDTTEGSSLVTAADLDTLISELQEAAGRMTALIMGHLYPEFLDQTGQGFIDYRQSLANDAEVAMRLKNAANERRRAEKKARRKPI